MLMRRHKTEGFECPRCSGRTNLTVQSVHCGDCKHEWPHDPRYTFAVLRDLTKAAESLLGLDTEKLGNKQVSEDQIYALTMRVLQARKLLDDNLAVE